jgi:hypothetical protein
VFVCELCGGWEFASAVAPGLLVYSSSDIISAYMLYIKLIIVHVTSRKKKVIIHHHHALIFRIYLVTCPT